MRTALPGDTDGTAAWGDAHAGRQVQPSGTAGRKPAACAEPFRAILVDDHPVVRVAVRFMLEATGRAVIVGEGADCDDACILYSEHRPDVVVLDLNLPGFGGLETIRRISSRDAAARILIFSMHAHNVALARALEAGAMGYLSKRAGDAQIVEAVFEVARGRPYLDPTYAKEMALRRLFSVDEDPLQALSLREFQIFLNLANGDSPAEIADKFFISAKTVSVHQANIMKKLALRNIAQLVRLAVRCKIIEP